MQSSTANEDDRGGNEPQREPEEPDDDGETERSAIELLAHRAANMRGGQAPNKATGLGVPSRPRSPSPRATLPSVAMADREERLALNEALFREMNERVEERVVATGREDEPFVVVCECGNIECLERLRLTVAEYDAAHAHPAQFVVVEGHVARDVEDVVARNEVYVVVRKRGRAGEIAAELDDTER